MYKYKDVMALMDINYLIEVLKKDVNNDCLEYVIGYCVSFTAAQICDKLDEEL